MLRMEVHAVALNFAVSRCALLEKSLICNDVVNL